MKVLITSGGTKIPIDKIRCISNQSSGTFGRDIAEEFDKERQDVIFVNAKGSKQPTFIYIGHQKHEFITFDDYRDTVLSLIQTEKPDIIILAAAVSDYGVKNAVDGKIRSSEDMVIELYKLPKVISEIRKLASEAVIVGFKMMVGSTEEELIEVAQASLVRNNIDLVVANDWTTIKGNHTIHIVEPNDVVCTVTRQGGDLNKAVVGRSIRAYDNKRKENS